jgi:hypothetical protein
VFGNVSQRRLYASVQRLDVQSNGHIAPRSGLALVCYQPRRKRHSTVDGNVQLRGERGHGSYLDDTVQAHSPGHAAPTGNHSVDGVM